MRPTLPIRLTLTGSLSIACIALLIAGLAGCGQTGVLYLPEEAKEKVEPIAEGVLDPQDPSKNTNQLDKPS